MKKILFISCLTTKKERFDGERIKCTLIYESFKKIADVSSINLSVHKYINTILIFFKSFFGKKKFNFVVISKDAHGANIIQKILKMARYPLDRVIYFEIGPFLYDRIVNGSIKKETFIKNRLIIVETPSMKEELKSIGFKKISVFPNFKPVLKIPFNDIKYPKETLNLIYLSRIEEPKGIYDLIDCLIELNKEKILFRLNVYGRPQSSVDDKHIRDLEQKHSFLKYSGVMKVDNIESYRILSNYDLHIFPTKYREGFPGSLIDFFIAGVPTLSSSFARSSEILSDKDSIIFEQGNIEDLKNKLLKIYNNQNMLINLRKNSYLLREKYSVHAFENYLRNLIEKNFVE